MNIMEFSTNLDSAKRVHRAACQLCQLSGICHWSVDLEHQDHLLRIKADRLEPDAIMQALTKAGLLCQLRYSRSLPNS